MFSNVFVQAFYSKLINLVHFRSAKPSKYMKLHEHDTWFTNCFETTLVAQCTRF